MSVDSSLERCPTQLGTFGGLVAPRHPESFEHATPWSPEQSLPADFIAQLGADSTILFEKYLGYPK
jgi:hypothetical protein